MKPSCLLAYLLLCSCSPTKVRFEEGYGFPLAMGTLLDEVGSGKPIELSFSRISLGREVLRSKTLALEVFAGAWAAFPEEHESSVGAGFSLVPRLMCLSFEEVKPYFGLNLGLGYADWKQQGSDFGFIVGPSIGVLYPLSDNYDVTLSWDLFHFSNAGTADPNPGLNADMIVLGIEYRF